MLRDAFEMRNRGDYDAFVEFSRADVLRHFEEMKEFIDVLEQYVKELTRGVAQKTSPCPLQRGIRKVWRTPESPLEGGAGGVWG